MGLPYDVTLERHAEPHWPPRCVRCGANDPEKTFRVRDGKPKVTVMAPACTGCARRLKLGRFVRLLVAGSAVVALMVAGRMLFGGDWWVRPVVFVVSLVLVGLLWIFIPPPFDITVNKTDIDYEFARLDLAEAFAEANGTTVDAKYEDDDDDWDDEDDDWDDDED